MRNLRMRLISCWKKVYFCIRWATLSHASLGKYLFLSHRIPGWTRFQEAEALADLSYSLPDDAVIVEVGSFLGAGTILLAGARESRASGRVHCVDPFDCSGDAYSAPIYRQIAARFRNPSLRECFESNIKRANLASRVEVHQGTAVAVARAWSTPIDMLVLDGDHSRGGARLAFNSWTPHLKLGGIVAIHNSNDRPYAFDHDGSRQIVLEEVVAPRYTEMQVVGTTTIARKAAQ